MIRKSSALLRLLGFDEDLRRLLAGAQSINNRIPPEGFQLSLFPAPVDHLIGVDEVGRGCLAGPVVASAVSFPTLDWTEGLNKQLDRLNDSKQVTAAVRNKLSESIIANAIWAVGEASVAEIDLFGITKATELAMERAVEKVVKKLPNKSVVVVVDGRKKLSKLPLRQVAILSADAKSASVAAASIVAKVHRDKIITALATDYPEYGWQINKGYPSAAHLRAMAVHGVSQVHRAGYGAAAIATLK